MLIMLSEDRVVRPSLAFDHIGPRVNGADYRIVELRQFFGRTKQCIPVKGVSGQPVGIGHRSECHDAQVVIADGFGQ